MTPARESLVLDAAALDALLPLHLRVSPEGTICGAGRAMRRLADRRPMIGRSVFDVFTIEKPSGITTMGRFGQHLGRGLRLRFREGRPVLMRGQLIRCAGGEGDLLLDLAFGLVDLEDLGGASLTAEDFAPSDPTVDILYLMEARSLAFSEMNRLIGRLQGAKAIAEAQAFTDTLTGVKNRRGFERILASVTESGEVFSICHIDLDHFKQVNDTLGHASGDDVLCAVAERLSAVVRSSDTVARVGGDEFTLILPGMVEPSMLDRVARRIVEELERPILSGGQECRISASIGISLSTSYATLCVETMIADADKALYRSKASGRAQHTIHGAAR